MRQVGKVTDYSSFVFDLDGTLIRLPVRWMEATEELERLFGVDKVVDPMFNLLGRLIEKQPSLKREAFSIIDRYEVESILSAKPVEGSVRLIQSLNGKGSICLVTMQGRKACVAALEKLGVVDKFGAIVTREDSLDRAEQIGIALEKVGGARGKTLFVADLENDLIAADKAGVGLAVIGRSRLEGLDPGCLFRDCDALSERLFS